MEEEECTALIPKLQGCTELSRHLLALSTQRVLPYVSRGQKPECSPGRHLGRYVSVLLSGSERAVIATGTKLLICVEHSFFFLSMISYVKTKCQWVSSSGNVF